jgi:hypothetical protein
VALDDLEKERWTVPDDFVKSGAKAREPPILLP